MSNCSCQHVLCHVKDGTVAGQMCSQWHIWTVISYSVVSLLTLRCLLLSLPLIFSVVPSLGSNITQTSAGGACDWAVCSWAQGGKWQINRIRDVREKCLFDEGEWRKQTKELWYHTLAFLDKVLMVIIHSLSHYYLTHFGILYVFLSQSFSRSQGLSAGETI